MKKQPTFKLKEIDTLKGKIWKTSRERKKKLEPTWLHLVGFYENVKYKRLFDLPWFNLFLHHSRVYTFLYPFYIKTDMRIIDKSSAKTFIYAGKVSKK